MYSKSLTHGNCSRINTVSGNRISVPVQALDHHLTRHPSATAPDNKHLIFSWKSGVKKSQLVECWTCIGRWQVQVRNWKVKIYVGLFRYFLLHKLSLSIRWDIKQRPKVNRLTLQANQNKQCPFLLIVIMYFSSDTWICCQIKEERFHLQTHTHNILQNFKLQFIAFMNSFHMKTCRIIYIQYMKAPM